MVNTLETLPQRAARFFKEGNFVILDTETTGTDPYSAEICEVSILDCDGTPIVDTLIKTSEPVPQGATRIHGITNEMLEAYEVPTFQDAFPSIRDAIQGKCVVIYNAGYDGPLLESVARRSGGLLLPTHEEFCLMLAYAEHYKAPGRYPGSYAWQSLTKACQQQHITLDADAHRALADALATYKLLQRLASLAETK